jgi:hypothetical protein
VHFVQVEADIVDKEGENGKETEIKNKTKKHKNTKLRKLRNYETRKTVNKIVTLDLVNLCYGNVRE